MYLLQKIYKKITTKFKLDGHDFGLLKDVEIPENIQYFMDRMIFVNKNQVYTSNYLQFDLYQFPNQIEMLQEYNCFDTLNGFIPKNISLLSNLKKISFTNCDIKSMIPELFELKHLEELNFSNNQIQVIPNSISNLKKLKKLNFKFNHLKEISEYLPFCTELEEIDFSNNLIQSIPNQLSNLKKLKKMNLDNNKLTDIPQLNLLDCKVTIQNNPLNFHLKKFENDFSFEKLNFHTKLGKIIFLGSGAVGKTQLCYRLVNQSSTPEQTEVINIHEWKFDNSVLSLYDFAGQEHYKCTYPLFLSTDIICLLYNMRNFRENEVDEWIETILKFNKKPKIILIGTHSHNSNVKQPYSDTFKDYIEKEFHIDSHPEKNVGIDNVRKYLQTKVHSLPLNYKHELLYHHILKNKQNVLSKDEFFNYCKEGVFDEKTIEETLSHLSKVGEVLRFDHCHDLIFLKPQFFSDITKEIITTGRAPKNNIQNGTLDHKQLPTIWNSKWASNILEIFYYYHILIPIPKKEQSIIPVLIESSLSKKGLNLDEYLKNEHLVWEFKGVNRIHLFQIMARENEMIKEFYKNGIKIEYDKELVIFYYENGNFYLYDDKIPLKSRLLKRMANSLIEFLLGEKSITIQAHYNEENQSYKSIIKAIKKNRQVFDSIDPKDLLFTQESMSESKDGYSLQKAFLYIYRVEKIKSFQYPILLIPLFREDVWKFYFIHEIPDEWEVIYETSSNHMDENEVKDVLSQILPFERDLVDVIEKSSCIGVTKRDIQNLKEIIKTITPKEENFEVISSFAKNVIEKEIMTYDSNKTKWIKSTSKKKILAQKCPEKFCSKWYSFDHRKQFVHSFAKVCPETPYCTKQGDHLESYSHLCPDGQFCSKLKDSEHTKHYIHITKPECIHSNSCTNLDEKHWMTYCHKGISQFQKLCKDNPCSKRNQLDHIQIYYHDPQTQYPMCFTKQVNNSIDFGLNFDLFKNDLKDVKNKNIPSEIIKWIESLLPVHRCDLEIFQSILLNESLKSRYFMKEKDHKKNLIEIEEHSEFKSITQNLVESKRKLILHFCNLKVDHLTNGPSFKEENNLVMVEKSIKEFLQAQDYQSLISLVEKIVQKNLSLSNNPTGLGVSVDEILGTNQQVFSIIGPHLGNNYGTIMFILKKEIMSHLDFNMTINAGTSFYSGETFKHRPWAKGSLDITKPQERIQKFHQSKFHPMMKNWSELFALDLCEQMQSISLENLIEFWISKNSHGVIEGHLPNIVPLSMVKYVIINQDDYDKLGKDDLDRLNKCFTKDQIIIKPNAFTNVGYTSPNRSKFYQELKGYFLDDSNPTGLWFSIEKEKLSFLPKMKNDFEMKFTIKSKSKFFILLSDQNEKEIYNPCGFIS